MTPETPPNAPPTSLNGIDVAALLDVVEAVRQDPAAGRAAFSVRTTWAGQTRTESRVESYRLGGQDIPRSFTLRTDEPLELLGSNQDANPQETLMAAVNACLMVGFVANAALRGVRLDRLEIELSGELDLRGFLGLDDRVNPGYDELQCTVHVRGDGTPEQMREIHDAVMQTSPNYANMVRPVRLRSKLAVL